MATKNMTLPRADAVARVTGGFSCGAFQRCLSARAWGNLLLLLAAGFAVGCGQPDAGAPKSPAKPEPSKGATPGGAQGATLAFEDITTRSGLDFTHQLADGKLSNIMESDGAGGAILDFDGDGWMDVYLVNSGPAPVLSDASPNTPRRPNGLFRNRGGGTFENVTAKAGVAGHGFGTTAAAADYDNDGDTDLLVVNFGGCILYQNQGGGVFKDVTLQAGIRTTNACISATFLDVDRDGFLDLFVANYLAYDPSITDPSSSAPYPGPTFYKPEFNILYRNRGDGTFEDISEQAGIRIPGHRAMSVAPLDFDIDGDEDLYVSNDGTPNLLLENDGHGHFKEVAMQHGVAFNQFGEAAGSMGAAVGDCNGDGLPDLLVTRFGLVSLYINSRQGFFEDRSGVAGLLEPSRAFTGWGGNFLDCDNDGDLDVFMANGNPHFMKGMPSLLLENQGKGTFVNVSAQSGPFFKTQVNARGSGVFDLDNDGHLDLIITTLGDKAILLRNRGPQQNHWLILQLEGTRSNRDGFGTWVKVRAGTKTWTAEARCPTSYVFQQEPRLHFGLGPQKQVDRLELRWPSGQTQVLTNVAADQILKIREPGAFLSPSK